MNLNKMTKFWYILLFVPLLLVTSCGDDDVAIIEPIASFQSEVDADDFFKVNFTNFSQNTTIYAWDFGDNVGTSSEESPSYTYTASGTYTITLTASDAAGASAQFSSDVIITDPNEALTLLSGSVSKTWKLLRDGSPAIGIGPSYEAFAQYFNTINDGKRNCLYDDEFIFTRAGGYEHNDGGTFWGEGGIYAGDLLETCFDATTENLTIDGVDKSAWLSSTSHTFDYDVANGKITLSGLGAWIGLVKLGTDGDVAEPQQSVTFNAVLADGGATGVDTLDAFWNHGDNVWRARYVSYANPADEPSLADEFVPEECTPEVSISPTEISHTFASNETSEWVLLQPVESGSGLDLGVDNPDATDAATTPLVGKYTRFADVSFQELQFKLDPLNAINFENLTTITMDVYMPSGNAYDAATLTDNVFIGFGATKCPPDWFTDQHEYQEMAIAKDTWVTITFQLDAAAYVAVPENGANVYERNDLDMIYIAIGGGNHGVGGEFFMKNFKIQ